MTEKEALDCFIHPTQHWSSESREADNLAMKALEKQIPKKPIKAKYESDCVCHCPSCNAYIVNVFEVDTLYCDTCGQKIDWSE